MNGVCREFKDLKEVGLLRASIIGTQSVIGHTQQTSIMSS